MNTNYLKKLREKIDHPSNLLWKAIELKTLNNLNLTYKPNILDIGAGDGILMECFFYKKSIDVGLELNANNRKYLSKSSVYKNVIFADISSPNIFKKSQFNTVMSFVTLHLIQDLDKCLNNISNSLCNNGRLIFTIPIDNFSKNLFFNFLGQWYPKFRNKKLNNIHLYSSKKWKNLLKKHGFIVEYSKGYMDGKTLRAWDFLAFFMRLPLSRYIIKILSPLGLNNLLELLYDSRESKNPTALLVVAKKIK